MTSRIAAWIGALVVSATATSASDPASDAAPRRTISGTVTIGPPDALVTPDVSRVVVYLDAHPNLEGGYEDPAAAPAPPLAERPQIMQKDKRFVPDLLVVTQGTWVEFPNFDDFSHNVFSRSAAAPPFDLDRYGYGLSKGYQFTKTGVVQVFCNIHPRMRATVFVTPNNACARVDDDGRFAIRDVPPGSYEVVAWHPRCHEAREVVVVGDAAPAPLEIALDQNLNRILTERRRRTERGPARGLGVRRERLDLPVVHEAHPACCPAPGATATATEEQVEAPH